MTDVPRAQPNWKTALEYALVAVVFAAMLAGIAVVAYSCQAEAIGAAEGFFVALREGHTQQAFESLAPERRLTFDDFRQQVSDRTYRENTDVAFGQTPQWGPVDGRMHACTSGSLRVEGEDWYTEVYLTKGSDDVWRVHTWGIQAPRTMSTRLLVQCKSAW